MIRLDYPVTPFIVTQPFGGNGKYYQDNGVDVVGHNGLDLRARHGQPVYAAHDGIAFYTEGDDKEGHGVVVLSDEETVLGDAYSKYKTIYWHLCDPRREPQFASPVFLYRKATGRNGMQVKRGQLIGYADNTGLSTGDHLHFGLKPLGFNEASGDWFNKFQLNGYGGAVDPLPYMQKPSLNAVEQVLATAAKFEANGDGRTAAWLKAIAEVVRSFKS